MVFLQELGIDLPWLMLAVAVVVGQYLLHRRSLVLQRREVLRSTELMEARVNRSTEREWTHLEAQLREFCDAQNGKFEELRGSLLENDLKRQAAIPRRSEQPYMSRLDKRHQVFALAQVGFSSRDIAQKLRLSRGETDLLLGLSSSQTQD